MRGKSHKLLDMRAHFGKGGWIGLDDVGLPGPLYLRMREAADGRLRITEFYLDASQSELDITQRDLRELPLSRIEAFINANREYVVHHINQPAPDLSTHASYFASELLVNYGDPRNMAQRHWVGLDFASQVPDEVKAWGEPPVRRPARVSKPWKVVAEDREFRLKSGPSDGLTDDFLRDVAKAYQAAVARGGKPNAAMAEQTGYPLRTVQRWVYIARLRGIMPRGRKGRAG